MILRSVGKERRGFRVAEVIESSHYQYIVAALLSFALLMIYRKQINDLNSSNKLRKTPSTCGGSRIVSRDSSATFRAHVCFDFPPLEQLFYVSLIAIVQSR